jgi:hypothetical protein
VSKPPAAQSEAPQIGAVVVASPDAGKNPAAKSQRVRELPPPPVSDTGIPTAKHGQDGRGTPSDKHGQDGRGTRTRDGVRRWWRADGRRQSLSAGVSFAVHFVALIVAALIVYKAPSAGGVGGLLLDGGEEYLLEDREILLDNTPSSQQSNADRRLADGASGSGEEHADSQTADASATANIPMPSGLQPASDVAAPAAVSFVGSGIGQSPNWLAVAEAATGGGLDGRKAAARSGLLAGRGGNDKSEAAVERGLRWLRAHQNSDGSWSCDHAKGPCQGLCRNPGTDACTTGSTALVLLAFLGAGYTHVDGEYQDTVKRGLYYLTTKAIITKHGADLQDGSLYGQGISTAALCEAYAMTGDKSLRDLAQKAIHFIVYAQDTRGGGWRYSPGQPGDTTVTGWQLTALKSGQMAGLEVPSPTIALIERFLDSVQTEEGACYGYRTTDPGRATTAVGLLCRMYTGWSRYRPALQRGVLYLYKWGPSDDNMYFNYYATQVMIQSDGAYWPTWNRQMRDFLIATQAKNSHESGSWYFPGGYGDRGGRLYNTAMAVMTLEVYYRYMPLYQKKSVESSF